MYHQILFEGTKARALVHDDSIFGDTNGTGQMFPKLYNGAMRWKEKFRFWSKKSRPVENNSQNISVGENLHNGLNMRQMGGELFVTDCGKCQIKLFTATERLPWKRFGGAGLPFLLNELLMGRRNKQRWVGGLEGV